MMKYQQPLLGKSSASIIKMHLGKLQ